MPISLSCPQCGKLYQLSDGLAGKRGRCKDCGTTFEIPGPRVAAPPPPPADLFAGLDGGEAVARPTSRPRPATTKFGPIPGNEVDDEPTPSRRGPSKPKRKAKVDHEAQARFRKSGVTIMVFGALAFVLPLVGLQWKVLAFMPTSTQEIAGASVVTIGAAVVGLSFATRPSKVLWTVAIVVFGLFAVVVAFAVVGQWMGLGRPRNEAPNPAFAGQPGQPPPMMPRAFVPPPANPFTPPAGQAEPPPADEILFTLSNARASRESGPGAIIRELTFQVDYRGIGKPIPGPPQFFWVIESNRTNAGRRMIGVNMESGTLSGSITVTDGDIGPFKTYLARENFGPGGRQRSKVSNVVDMQWMGDRAANDSMIPTAPAQPQNPTQPPTNAPPGMRRGFPNMPGRPGLPRRFGRP